MTVSQAVSALIDKLKAENAALREDCGKSHAQAVLAKHKFEQCEKELNELREQYRELLLRNNKNATN